VSIPTEEFFDTLQDRLRGESKLPTEYDLLPFPDTGVDAD